MIPRNLIEYALILAVALCLVVCTGPSVQADIVFQLGNNPQPDQENVLLTAGMTGKTVTGQTNQSQTAVDFTSTQALKSSSNGQSQIVAIDSNGNQVALDVIAFTIPNATFGSLILSPFLNNGQGPGTAGTATVTVKGVSATNVVETDTYNYAIGAGNNFVTVRATNGERITSVSVLDPNGFSDLEQVRVADVTPTLTPVPEPGSFALLTVAGVMFGVVGFVRRARS